MSPSSARTACIGLRAKTGRAIAVVLAEANALRWIIFPEHGFETLAASRLELSIDAVRNRLAEIGQRLGHPLRADEKAAALAAWIGLASVTVV
jgi:hypothetical protein